MSNAGRVIALAGRRIDTEDGNADAGSSGFPLARVGVVASRLRATFRSLGAGTLVSSAANGADLIALRVARELGMRRRIILPFSAARFRRVSVTDREGGELWGWLFDELIADARNTGDLLLLRRQGASDDAAFEGVNARIVAEAAGLARSVGGKVGAASRLATRTPVGVAVWNGRSRGSGDATAMFCERLRREGYPVRNVGVSAP